MLLFSLHTLPFNVVVCFLYGTKALLFSGLSYLLLAVLLAHLQSLTEYHFKHCWQTSLLSLGSTTLLSPNLFQSVGFDVLNTMRGKGTKLFSFITYLCSYTHFEHHMLTLKTSFPLFKFSFLVDLILLSSPLHFNSIFLGIFFQKNYAIYYSVCVSLCPSQCTYGGQRDIKWSQFFLPSIWILEIKVRITSLTVGFFTH